MKDHSVFQCSMDTSPCMELNACACTHKQKHEGAVRLKSVDHMSDSLEVSRLSLGRHYQWGDC